MPVHDHIHKYERGYVDKERTSTVYICRLPDCSHFIGEVFIIGKKSICWKCQREFVIDKATTKLVKLNCGCGRRNKKAITQIDESEFSELLKKIKNIG